jgi:type I restriction enzyme S subunit
MDGKQLKNSILQWAIQGKLVPQNPKDEPAQKLLERIAKARNEYSAVSACHPERSAKGTKSKDLKKKTSKNPTSRIYRENGVWYEQIGIAAPKDISDEIPFEIPESWAWCRLKDAFETSSGSTPLSSPWWRYLWQFFYRCFWQRLWRAEFPERAISGLSF